MAYTPATTFPANIFIGQWETPDDPTPRLAFPIADTDTGFTATSALVDKDGIPITGSVLVGIDNSDGYVETVWCPAGSSTDGMTFTGVVRGVRLSGLDYTTAGTGLAVDHPQDSRIHCNISAILFQMMIGAMTGSIGSGGTSWKVGDGTDSNVTVYAFNADTNKPAWRYNATTNIWEYSNDGVTYQPFGTGSGLTASTGVQIASGDIRLNTSDTTKFKSTSAGASDSSKVPILDGSGLLDPSFLTNATVSKLSSSGTANTTTTDKYALAYNGNTRLDLADGNDATLNPEWLFAGIANGASTSGNAQNYYPPGPIVTIPTFSVSDRQGCRLWDGEAQATSNTTTDTISSTTAWRAQTFTPSSAAQDNVGGVTINITNSVLSGTMQCAIYATSGGLPTGAALGTATALTSFASGDLTFSFSTPVSVTAGTTYAIVVWLSAYTAGNFAWNYQNTNPYSGGQRCTSSNSGGSWTGDSTSDYRFTIKYRGISGEPIFLSDTAGLLSLTPGTYGSIVGYAVTTSTMVLKPERPTIYATYTTTLSSASGTTTTQITTGFRPRWIYMTAYCTDGTYYATATGFQHIANSGGVVFGSDLLADSGSGATLGKINTFNIVGQMKLNPTTNYFYPTAFGFSSADANSVTMTRTIGGSSNNATFAAHILIIG